MASRATFAGIFGALGLVAVGCSLAVDTSGLDDGAGVAPSEGGTTAEASDDRLDATARRDGEGFGAEDAADADADASSDACPSGRGPLMLRVRDTHGAFCIDTTEVTNAQFNGFVADAKRPTPPASCAYRTSYGGIARPNDSLPVTDVDWCEAWMFCAWAGKRLCGSRNGTVINSEKTANDVQISEWYAACTRTGDTKLPYGSTADKTRCNTCDRTNQCSSDAGLPSLVPVASLPCQGGYAGVFDMSGNVGEWEDNCDGDQPSRQGTCPTRGGNRGLTAAGSACAVGDIPAFSHREDRSPVAGIRCCAD